MNRSIMSFMTQEGKTSLDRAKQLKLLPYYDVMNGTYCVPMDKLTDTVQQSIDTLLELGYGMQRIDCTGEVVKDTDPCWAVELFESEF